MLEALGERREERLWTRVDALRRLVADHADQPDLVWRRVLSDRIRTRAEALREEIARAGVLYAPEPLHAVRIATKKLRYAVELAGDLHLGATVSALRTLKRQQELLGRIHDLEILAGLADRATAEAPRYVSSARLVGDWHREVRERHASYLRARPRLEEVVTALATNLPVSVAGSRRRLGGKHGRTRQDLPRQARHRRRPRR
jgi:CHAD domain-containing protein